MKDLLILGAIAIAASFVLNQDAEVAAKKSVDKTIERMNEASWNQARLNQTSPEVKISSIDADKEREG